MMSIFELNEKYFGIRAMVYDFISFIKQPHIYNSKQKINPYSFFLFALIVFSCTLPFAFIDQQNFIKDFFQIKEDIHLSEFFKNKTSFFISVVFIAPLMEECLFRLFIDKISYIGLLFFGWIGLFFYFFSPLSSVSFWLIFCLSSIMCTVVIVKIHRLNSLLALFQKKYFKLIFYFSAFLFGAAHIANYQIFGYKSLLALGLVIPQIMAGFYLGYMRLRYGFLYAILLHMFDNFLGFFFFISLLSIMPYS